MSATRPPLVARWSAVQNAALRLAQRLQWLSDGPMLLTPQETEREMQEGRLALDRLVGNIDATDSPAGPPRGTMGMSKIPAAIRCDLLERSLHRHPPVSARALARFLVALRGT